MAFEATDHLSLAHSLFSATMHVGLGSRVVPKSDDNDAMESSIGLPMSAAVEPMPVGLAGGSGYGIDPVQGGECSLGVASATPASTARAAISASVGSRLPLRYRVDRSGRLTSTTVTPRPVRNRASPAP